MLSICGKISEILIFKEMLRLFPDNKIVARNQSDLKHGNSCINLLLSEVKSVFLDISKAFDKVWRKGVILKLEKNSIFGDLMNILRDFLSNIGPYTILAPLLFLIYIKDLPGDLSSNVKPFADDTFLFYVVHDINVSAGELNEGLKKISDWAFQWKMSFNPDDCKQAQEV